MLALNAGCFFHKIKFSCNITHSIHTNHFGHSLPLSRDEDHVPVIARSTSMKYEATLSNLKPIYNGCSGLVNAEIRSISGYVCMPLLISPKIMGRRAKYKMRDQTFSVIFRSGLPGQNKKRSGEGTTCCALVTATALSLYPLWLPQ